ncbi:MAG: oligosaccharide flippase family protein [Proteobacteria bacterium]|nr:oligosaccharide flippase family protein [Pseudomonadota bacterium]
MPEDIEKNAALAKSVGTAFLGRLGALVEVAALPILAGLYGGETLGLFFTLWSAVRVSTTLSEFAMSTTLQRFVPRTEDPRRAAGIFKIAVATSLLISTFLAVGFVILAPQLAEIVHAGEADKEHLVSIIRVYAWVLPFWTLTEVLTASVRAHRRFGPEIRIRIFYEQGLRLTGAVVFYLLGFHSFGLFFAHLFSVAVAAFLAFRLAARFYQLDGLFSRRGEPGLGREMMAFAIMMTPANLIKKLNSDLPILLLNQLLPGAAGAQAAAIYGIGRRIASLLQVIRQSFEYVVAPYASFRHARAERQALSEMYAFTTRLISCLVLPIGVIVILIRHDLLAPFSKDYQVAGGVILILALGRIIEGLTGPSSALIEMMAGRLLPLFNGLAGLTTLFVLQYWLTPEYGAVGAAVAAAAGLNVTAILSLGESWIFFRLQPYRLSLLRPLAVSSGAALIAGLVLPQIAKLGAAASVVAGVVAVALSLLVLVRWGFEPRDVAALGRVGRVLSRKKA